MEDLIGREEEKKLLSTLYQSKKAEFLAIYGRRRIGKTFLVNQFFKNKGVFFEITGSVNASTNEQLLNFHREFCALFKSEDHLEQPKNWSEAFSRLKDAIKTIRKGQKVVIFLDELPWLATPKSDFLSALDYSWNRHLSRISNVLLIVSGSAASWMIKQVINNTGGLYGRLSAHMRLLPFSLTEVEEYLHMRGIALPRKQICEIYMVTGGVPKYLTYLEPGLSAAQSIHYLCFTPQSPLITEFHKLYQSLFKNSEVHINIVSTLARKRYGMTRTELLKTARIANTGHITRVLQELEESGFLMTLPQMDKQSRDVHYYLSDEYSLFYLNWIDPEKGALLQGVEKDYWLKRQSMQKWHIWAGFAFESLCLKHLVKIKDALKIGAVSTKASYWKSIQKGKKEAEIDLVIDRADQCINLCEIKFHNSSFSLTKKYASELQGKREIFRKRTKTNKALFTTLITSFGAKENAAYLSCIDNQISVEDLF